ETVKPLTTNEKENWTRKIQDGLGKNADSIKKLLQDMDGDQRLKQVGEGKNLKKGLAKQVLENEKHLEAVAADPDLCAELVSRALDDKDDKDLVCDRDRLKKGLGEHEAAVAAKVLARKCADEVPDGWKGWMLDKADVKVLNDRKEGLAAEVYNKMWNAQKY